MTAPRLSEGCPRHGGFAEMPLAPCICRAPRLSETPDVEAAIRNARCECGHPVWDGWHKRKIGCEGDDCPCLLDAPQALAPVLAAAVREAEQRAWDEGWNAAGDAYVIGLNAYATGQPMPESGDGPPNPYRADRIAVDATRTDQADEATKEDR